MEAPKIVRLHVALAGDRRRVRLQAEIEDISMPFPYLEFTVIDPDDNIVARTLIMGVMDTEAHMTLHLRPPAAEDETRSYLARGRLFYGEEGKEDETFSVVERAFTFPLKHD